MRYKNESQELKLYAVAGTQTVLLSFDILKTKLEGDEFIGFWVERKDKQGKIIYLNGAKHFASLATNPKPEIRNTSLVQSFYWQDYEADPGQTYTYTIKPMFGSAINHSPKYENSIKVTTEKLNEGEHSVFFNYGVTGSQGYARNKEFGNTPINKLKGKAKEHALEFLGRDLWIDGLLKFVRQATGKKFSIYGAFYEFALPEFLSEIKQAKQRGVDVQLIVSGKAAQYNDHKDKSGAIIPGSKTMIAKYGLAKCVKTLRTKPSSPHNKFMILCENGIPKQVWTGSTNITESGVFGHCNTGHWIVNNDIAKKYFEYWNALIGNPAMAKVAETSKKIMADTDLSKLAKGSYVFFSPRDLPDDKKAAAHLVNYSNLIAKAEELVCMVFPFNYDDVFNNVFKKDRDFLRLLIFESATEAQKSKAESNDTDLKVTAGAVYTGKEKDWAKEVTSKTSAGAAHVLYVHNKFFIIDPLSAHPIVLTGSANFSNNSIRNNDENSILIKGDARVADIYLTEFDRLFVHFWPRYLAIKKPKSKTPQGFAKPLDETYTWHNDYFDSKKFACKRKKLFIKMYGAKKG
jgi:phosphatidylserine/phosphatidylglycerophosphate/cardiolipin synthase-like enzyme